MFISLFVSLHGNVISGNDEIDYEQIKTSYANYYNKETGSNYNSSKIWMYDYLGIYEGYELMIILPFDIESNYQDGEFMIGKEIFYYSDNIYSYYFYAYQNGNFIRVEDAYHQGIFNDIDITNIAYQTGLKKPSFNDVKKNSWYYTMVEQANRYGLMQSCGSPMLFQPYDFLTRAMAVTILYRMEKQDKTNQECSLKDVKMGLWYSDAITWAFSNQIVSGYANGYFGVDDPIKREDFAVMLANYARFKGFDINDNSNFDQFVDQNEIDEYASSALAWCIQNEILSGSQEKNQRYLYPKDYATRAQCVKMVVKFYELMK